MMSRAAARVQTHARISRSRAVYCSHHGLQLCKAAAAGRQHAFCSSNASDRGSADNWWTREVFTPPNCITFARIAGTPYVCLLLVGGEYQSAFYGLAFCGFLDWADGVVARLTKTESALGSHLDPLSDKFLLCSVSLTMAWNGMLPAWVVALILSRDLALVVGGVGYRLYTKPPGIGFWDTSAEGTLQMKPLFVSKVNTALQLCMVGSVATLAAWPGLGGSISPLLVPTLCNATAATTVLSGLGYAYYFTFDRATLLKRIYPKNDDCESDSGSTGD